MEKDLKGINEFFTQHNIELKKANDELIVHYQVYANKELTSFEVTASLVYLIRKQADQTVADEFHSFETPSYSSEYITSMKLSIDHEKEAVTINILEIVVPSHVKSSDKISSLKDLDIEIVAFNELVKLAKEYAKESYLVNKESETIENVTALKEKTISKCKILTISEMLEILKKIASQNYELKKENLILEEANANQKSMLKGMYNEKMAVYKSIVATLVLLGISVFLIL